MLLPGADRTANRAWSIDGHAYGRIHLDPDINANSFANPHQHTNRQPNAFSDRYHHYNRHCHAYRHSYANDHTYLHQHPYTHRYSYYHRDTHAGASHGNCHTGDAIPNGHPGANQHGNGYCHAAHHHPAYLDPDINHRAVNL
jgi:hypothetical protein